MIMTKDKSYKIQVLRGLAIIAVVFIHNTPVGLIQVWVRPFLNICVGCFLFLSGLLSSADKWNPFKRIIKVIIPYIIWTLVYVIIYYYNTPGQIPKLFIEQLVTATAAAVMYYVFVYCEFTLLIPLIDKLARSKYKYVGFAISPIEIIVMRLIPLITGYKLNNVLLTISDVSCLVWFTYYYLGYLLGNNIIKIRKSTSQLFAIWAVSIVLQILEGFWYYSMGDNNCGTQVKLSAIFSGAIFVLLAYKYIESSRKMTYKFKILHLLGDCSFGIFFSHLAIMAELKMIPLYMTAVVYPFNAVVVTALSCVCVLLWRKIVGKFRKEMAL